MARIVLLFVAAVTALAWALPSGLATAEDDCEWDEESIDANGCIADTLCVDFTAGKVKFSSEGCSCKASATISGDFITSCDAQCDELSIGMVVVTVGDDDDDHLAPSEGLSFSALLAVDTAECGVQGAYVDVKIETECNCRNAQGQEVCDDEHVAYTETAFCDPGCSPESPQADIEHELCSSP